MYIPSSDSSCGAVSNLFEFVVSSTYNDNKNENKQLIGV